MTLSDLLREYARLADLLDWRLTFEPPVSSHREAFEELRETVHTNKLRARGVRRDYTDAVFGSLAPQKPADIEVYLDLGMFYPTFDQNGRATGDMYPVESGPVPSLLVRNVSVEVTGLKESWRSLTDGRAGAASPIAEQVKTDASNRAKRVIYYGELRKYMATKKPEYLARLGDVVIEQEFRKLYEREGGSLPGARYVITQIRQIRADLASAGSAASGEKNG
jgi:hypothetical protein